MKSFMFNFFSNARSKSKPKPPTVEQVDKFRAHPKAGEKWRINDGDPFPPKSTATILDVKDGWVRYTIGSGTIFNDERKAVENFMSSYRFYSKE